MKALKIGDVVTVNRSVLSEPNGVKAVVYEVYPDFDDPARQGVSLLTENGKDLGGFSYEEQRLYLSFVRSTGFRYKFESVGKLYADVRSGAFRPVFMERERNGQST